jgi:hypothetical protein
MKTILTLALFGVTVVVKFQNSLVEKSLFGILTGLIGILVQNPRSGEVPDAFYISGGASS